MKGSCDSGINTKDFIRNIRWLKNSFFAGSSENYKMEPCQRKFFVGVDTNAFARAGYSTKVAARALSRLADAMRNAGPFEIQKIDVAPEHIILKKRKTPYYRQKFTCNKRRKSW